MKTYQIHSIFKYVRASSYEIDDEGFFDKIFCNRVWRVFSNVGEKKVEYIFNQDQSIAITIDDQPNRNGKWGYMPKFSSMYFIDETYHSHMIHIVYADDSLMVFQFNGTDHLAFLINDQMKNGIIFATLQGILDYLQQKLN